MGHILLMRGKNDREVTGTMIDEVRADLPGAGFIEIENSGHGPGSDVPEIFNGLVIGGVSGHLTRLGYQETFWPFVSGHGAFELTAIVICGAAGLLLGMAVLAPGPLGRLESLKANALEALQLVMGAALMLVVAAFIEAFWSPSGASPEIKYAVAAMLWLWVILYLSLMGRGQGGSH